MNPGPHGISKQAPMCARVSPKVLADEYFHKNLSTHVESVAMLYAP